MAPAERLGAEQNGGFEALKSHPFFEGINVFMRKHTITYAGIDWKNLTSLKPPTLDAYLPAIDPSEKDLHGKDVSA